MKNFEFSSDLIKALSDVGVTWDEPPELLSSAHHAFSFSNHLISGSKKNLTKELQKKYQEIAKLAKKLHVAAAGLPELEKKHAGFNLWDWLLRPVRDDLYGPVGKHNQPMFNLEQLMAGRDISGLAKGVADVAIDRASGLSYGGGAPRVTNYGEFLLQFCYTYACRPCAGMSYEDAKIASKESYLSNKSKLLTVAALVIEHELKTGKDMRESISKSFDDIYDEAMGAAGRRYR